jgi:AcrR family transcriptional regulator
MLTALTLRLNVSCVNINPMTGDSSYHHGDLRAALLKAAAAEIERSGYENLSLRELAASLGVSRAAPYRHFVDRRALLSALAADGFTQLTASHRAATGRTARARLQAAGRAYLAFAAARPQLYRLMFVSDLFSAAAGPLDPGLLEAGGESYQVFEDMVAATLGNVGDKAVKAATITYMSSTYGFALLRINDRLKPFMYGDLRPDDLVDALLSVKVTVLPGRAGKRNKARTARMVSSSPGLTGRSSSNR